MRFLLMLFVTLLFAVPEIAPAQVLPRPHAELPSADQPARRVAITGYTLALSWAPEYCHAHKDAAQAGGECADRATRSRFTLHGLWPDGAGPNLWPQYCHPVAILTDAQLRAGIAVTPSPQLLQHEWAKHGSCTGADPVAFFAEEGRLFATVHAPDMVSLAHRRGLTVDQFEAAFAAANPGLRPEMMRLDVNKKGWLEEVWLCLGLDKRPRACPAGAGGAAAGTALKVQAAS